MVRYGKIITASGGEVLYEIEGPVAGRVSRDQTTASLEKRIEDIMAVVKETSENAYQGLHKIDEKTRPSEYSMKFGLKLGLGTNLLFAKGESEATFEVTLKWTRPE
jgi:hypothetical protein